MKNSTALLLGLLLYALLFLVAFNRISSGPRGVIWSDAEGYYKYLPGLFILRDFHKLDAGSVWPYYNDKGEFVNKFTCGVAYFHLPFFLIGHAWNALKKGPPI